MKPSANEKSGIRPLNAKRKFPRVADIDTSTFLHPVAELPAYGDKPEALWELEDVEVIGKRVRSLAYFQRGTVVARFAGTLTYEVMQHTLQVTPTTHILDTNMVGYLSHSCGPNCLLDMTRLEVLALKDIRPGEILSIDYAVTEDVLFKQFPCSCGSPECRHWVTGRREQVNPEGVAYLQHHWNRK
ncbi:MAG: SET domain-containing protein-lysine N-methyltransferase [Alphaproteobacteria bacterium]|nr:SET domain-containing protein-lysine N-methyltransferase [Alphaproteobacteria bacterium]MBF0250337.1 SET domain-containing protein-lysine N-methyltransferase [Alphaproteobacteria bacterium]